MPTIEINPGDRVKFLDSQGALASEFSYDENGGAIMLQDDQGNPADQKVGALEADDVTINNAVAVYALSTDQIITSNTTTTIEFDNVKVDKIGSMDTSTFKWSPNTDGLYKITANISVLDASADGELLTQLSASTSKFGEPIRNTYTSVNTGDTSSGQINTVFPLTTSDDFEIRFRHKTGSDEVVDSDRVDLTRLEVVKVA